jgi:hypothetical protein
MLSASHKTPNTIKDNKIKQKYNVDGKRDKYLESVKTERTEKTHQNVVVASSSNKNR